MKVHINGEGNASREEEREVQCGLDIKTRRHCQYCRYKRCIEIGNDLINWSYDTTTAILFIGPESNLKIYFSL